MQTPSRAPLQIAPRVAAVLSALAGALWNVELALGARPWRFAIPTAFMVLGLLGAHAIQAHRAARLGKIGLGLSVLGLALTVTGTITMPAKRGEAIGGPEAVSLLGFAFLVLGLVLFGIATLRARVLPRWSRPLPLFMALSLTGSMPTLGILPPAQLFGYGWVLFGLALWPVDKTPPSPVPSASSSRAMLWGKVTIKLLASAILTLWTLGLPALLSAIGMTSLGWLAGRRRPALMAAWLVAGLVLGPLVVAFLRSRPYLCGPSDLWTFLWSFGHPTHLGGLAGIAVASLIVAPRARPASALSVLFAAAAGTTLSLLVWSAATGDLGMVAAVPQAIQRGLLVGGGTVMALAGVNDLRGWVSRGDAHAQIPV